MHSWKVLYIGTYTCYAFKGNPIMKNNDDDNDFTTSYLKKPDK